MTQAVTVHPTTARLMDAGKAFTCKVVRVSNLGS